MVATQSKSERYASRLHASFPFFLREVFWVILRLEPTRTQIEMADWLQNGPADRNPALGMDIGILAYRESAKTWVLVAYVLWRLMKEPKKVKAKFVSETEGHAKKSLLLARDWIRRIPFLRFLDPKNANDGLHRCNETELDVGPCSVVRSPSIHAIGITGQVTGERATLLILDDIETSENTMTVAQRDRIDERRKELELTGRKGDRVAIGTYHHEESVYLKMAEVGYTFRAWTSRYPAKDKIDRTLFLAPQIRERLRLGKVKAGEPLDPEFCSDADLRRIELKIGASKFQQQLQLIPGATDGTLYPLKQSDLIVFTPLRDKAPSSIAWGLHTSARSTAVEGIGVVGFTGDGLYSPIMVDEHWATFSGTKAFLDPAGAGADEMAWAICGQLHGYLYLKHIEGISGPAKLTIANLEHFADTLREHGATELWIESNFGGESIAVLLEPILQRKMLRPLDGALEKREGATSQQYPQGWACSVNLIHNSVQKEIRIIDTMEPVMNQHRLVVSESVARDRAFMRQLTRITKQRNCLEHDDRLDAAAGVIAQWRSDLGQDPTKQAQREADRVMQEQLEEFWRDIPGLNRTKGRKWVNV